MKTKFKLLTVLLFAIMPLSSCGGNNNSSNSVDLSDSSNGGDSSSISKESIDDDGAIALSFKSALSFDYLKSIDGKKVKINGYMATSSPVDGSFIFLMNLPYQNCPFCKPNTSTLSNTIEVYPKKGKSFRYTESAIKIVGDLLVAESEDKTFVDSYGYEFNFMIENASYIIVDESELSGEVTLWNQIAQSSLISDIYDMLNYVNFTVKWPTYFVDSYLDINDNTVPGYYLWPGDAQKFLEPDGAQFNYGYKDSYFPNLIKKCKKLSEEKLAGAIEVINVAKQLASDGIDALYNGDYVCHKDVWVEKFQTYDNTFTLNKEAEFNQRMDDLVDMWDIWFTSFLDNMEM